MRDMQRSMVWAMLLGLALAAPCKERPYTLETEEGLLGGQEMTYDGEVLVFEGEACLERQGLYLEAPVIRYLEGEGTFQAEGVKGEAEGWRLEAQALSGKDLLGVRLARGRLRAEAQRLRLESPLKGEGILLETPAYRVSAKEGGFTREEARLRGFLATPCPCGEDVRLSMEEALFSVATGELKGEASLGLWGLEIPLGEAKANANRRPDLRSPLVLAGTDTGGWTLGVQDLPLPKPGEELGRWERRFTLLATGLGTGKEALRLGVREGGRGAQVQLGYTPGVQAHWDDLFFAATPPSRCRHPRLEARYTPSLRLDNLALNPFLRYAETGRSQGTTVGLEAGYRETFRQGPLRFTLAPSLLLALYPFTPYAPYLALGGGLEALYQEGELSLRLAYAGRMEPLNPTPPPFTYENRDEFQRLSLEGQYGTWALRYTLENPLGQRLDRFEGQYGPWSLRYTLPNPSAQRPERLEGEVKDPDLGTLRLAYVRGSLEEVRLATPCPFLTATAARPFGFPPRWAWPRAASAGSASPSATTMAASPTRCAGKTS